MGFARIKNISLISTYSGTNAVKSPRGRKAKWRGLLQSRPLAHWLHARHGPSINFSGIENIKEERENNNTAEYNNTPVHQFKGDYACYWEEAEQPCDYQK